MAEPHAPTPCATELPVVELPASTSPPEGTDETIRCFRLCAGSVTVELCSLGASITRLLLPSRSATDSDAGTSKVDDCVLGYASPVQMMEGGNPTYLGVVVGRVANRIKSGSFRLKQRDGEEATSYVLEKNNGPNHLHGGVRGFGSRVWDAEIVKIPLDDSDGSESVPGVRFALISDDGDQGYPGRVRVTATYSLRPNGAADDEVNDVVLRLCLCASLLSDKFSSPINLAQHSYFNLSGHSSPDGVLDHVLTMPICDTYLPVDGTSIPTREVRSVEKDAAMDFRDGRILREALVKYGMSKASRTEEEANKDVQTRQLPEGVEPYGIDHCYRIDRSATFRHGVDGSLLRLAGRVEHPPTSRRLEVWTDAPGVQIYTANYLDGKSPDPGASKDGATYKLWQGVCLETQCFPDSILLDDEDVPADQRFSDGKCFVLRPGEEDYVHNVEYVFGVVKHS